jgi:hypothetical protein
MEDSLKVLKLRLLLQTLDRVQDSAQHALLIQEARFAGTQAARTPFPELLFPCLFEERVAVALELDQRKQRAYWSRLATPALAS